MIETDGLSNLDGTETLTSERIVRGAAKAWANFNSNGATGIRNSQLVSSLTDLGVGHIQVNLAANMADVGYAVSGLVQMASVTGGTTAIDHMQYASSVSQVQVRPYNSTQNAPIDNPSISVVIHGDLAP